MELPQSRPFGSRGTKPTHDFLSLYSPAHQDPAPTPPGYLETHDFLQPLDGLGTNVAKDGNKVEVTSIEKSLPPSHSTVEHILPGGIGTYTISHVSYINQSQRAQKSDGVVITATKSSSSDKDDENSNCSSYAGSGFSLWEESDLKKGKTGKENIAGNRHLTREMGMKIGVPWTTSMEQPSQLSSIHNYPSTTMSSLTSFHPSSAQKTQSFVDMLKFAKSVQEDEDDEDDEFVIKKEPSSHHKGVLSMKVDTENHDRKPNTPRSKHSATEQRRRSKINDRFSMLRELIPHGDQKRDKASFLLEVIEYIQFLQEKVHKYEDSYRGWNEPPKMMPWNNSQTPSDGFIDQTQFPNGTSDSPFTFATKFEENKTIVASPNVPRNVRYLTDGQHPRLTNEASPLVVPMQPNLCPPASAHTISQPQLRQSISCTSDQCTLASDKSKERDMVIENGAISISTIYSQGLLSSLTKALQSSGVDLSQAQVSVQIELGKTPNRSKLKSSMPPTCQKTEVPSIRQTLARSRLAGTQEEENDRGFKRSKRSRN